MANSGPWYGFEREAATVLHLVEYDQATSNGIERETIERGLRRAYERGAEAMRERAAAECRAEEREARALAERAEDDDGASDLEVWADGAERCAERIGRLSLDADPATEGERG